MGFESVVRLLQPAEIHFDEAIPVAILGLAVNLVSAWLLSMGRVPHTHGPAHGRGHAHAQGEAGGHSHPHADVAAARRSAATAITRTSITRT